MHPLFTSGGLFFMKRAVYGAAPTDQLAEYLAVFFEPGALSAAFNWYRSAEFLTGKRGGNVEQPILYVFGNRDMAVFVRPEVRKLHPHLRAQASKPQVSARTGAGMRVRVARADNAESFDTLSSRVNLVAA